MNDLTEQILLSVVLDENQTASSRIWSLLVCVHPNPMTPALIRQFLDLPKGTVNQALRRMADICRGDGEVSIDPEYFTRPNPTKERFRAMRERLLKQESKDLAGIPLPDIRVPVEPTPVDEISAIPGYKLIHRANGKLVLELTGD